MEGISQHIRAEGGEHIIDAEFLDRSVYIEVFQGILQKRECTLSYLTLEGALWCDKVRPGEFGGHAARIYCDRVVAITTPGTIEVLEGIAQAAQNALNSWEHGDLAGAMRDLRDTVEAAVPGYLVV